MKTEYRNSDDVLRRTLEGAVDAGTPVRRLVYIVEANEKPPDKLITYECTGSKPVMSADDEVTHERHSYSIDIYATVGHVSMLRRIREALYRAGFDDIEGMGETYLYDWKLFQTTLTCTYTESLNAETEE